jgi:hypothetical protein
MFKKLLQWAAVVFLILSFIVAVMADAPLASGGNRYYSDTLLGFTFIYPMVVAVILWEHGSSLKLKYLSAGVGFIATLVLVHALGFNAFVGKDLAKWIEILGLILYFFVFVSSFTAIVGRVLKLLWRLIQATIVKVNSLSRTMGLLPR